MAVFIRAIDCQVNRLVAFLFHAVHSVLRHRRRKNLGGFFRHGFVVIEKAVKVNACQAAQQLWLVGVEGRSVLKNPFQIFVSRAVIKQKQPIVLNVGFFAVEVNKAGVVVCEVG